MTALTWNDAGKRYYESGVDRGVLYPPETKGVAWNGIIAVRQKPSGGTAIPHYMEGIKYLNRAELEEFEATIDCYTFPDEFLEFDGYHEHESSGMYIGQQERDSFGLSYRSGIGNDLDTNVGYKVHIVYNALASPTQHEYKTLSNVGDPTLFSYDITTMPEIIPGYTPSAHIILDSRKVHPTVLQAIEAQLYGSETNEPRLLTPAELLQYFVELTIGGYELITNFDLGAWNIVSGDYADILPTTVDGIYDIPMNSRLVEESPGIYKLEA
jgi:hypothetical protein